MLVNLIVSRERLLCPIPSPTVRAASSNWTYPYLLYSWTCDYNCPYGSGNEWSSGRKRRNSPEDNSRWLEISGILPEWLPCLFGDSWRASVRPMYWCTPVRKVKVSEVNYSGQLNLSPCRSHASNSDNGFAFDDGDNFEIVQYNYHRASIVESHGSMIRLASYATWNVESSPLFSWILVNYTTLHCSESVPGSWAPCTVNCHIPVNLHSYNRLVFKSKN